MSKNITDPLEALYEFAGSKFYDLRKTAKDLLDSQPEPERLTTDQIRLLVDVAIVEMARDSQAEIDRTKAVISPGGRIKYRHLHAVQEVG